MNKIRRKMQRNEMAIFPLYFQGISFIIFNKFVAVPLFKTSSAEAEISDGPHKRVLRRAGPNTKRYIYFNTFCFYLFVLLAMFSIFFNLSTIHNLATYMCQMERSTIHNFTFQVVFDQFFLILSFFNLQSMLERNQYPTVTHFND